MVSGSVIAWLVLIPLLTVLAIPDATVDAQLASLGFSAAKIDAWRLSNDPERYYRAYVRLIGAGAVTMAGIITLIRTHADDREVADGIDGLDERRNRRGEPEAHRPRHARSAWS